MATQTTYLVTAFGGVNASADRQEVWHRHQGAAENDVRRRLGVKKLHVKARSSGYVTDLEDTVIRDPEGTEWHRYAYYDFYRVSASGRDYDRSGGFKISFLERELPSHK